MKNKVFLRSLSLLLTLALLLCPLLSVLAFAGTTGTEDCPYIYVHGFMGSNVYLDVDDPNSEVIFPPSADSILATVKECLPAIAEFSVTHNYQRLADKTIPAVTEMFSPCICDPDGTANGNSGVRFKYPSAGSIKKNSHLRYVYDWRLDPIEIATGLDKYIDYVLQSSKAKQVVLEGHSFGGVILNTYATLFGHKNAVRSYFFNSTAVNGETYNGELMTGKMTLDADGLTEYLKSILDGNEYEKLLDGLFDMFNKAGLTDVICKFGNRILDKIGMRACTESVVPMFGGWLSIWAMVPDEYINDAMDYVFKVIYKNSTVDRSGLIAKITDYNTRIRPNKLQTMKNINEQANLYIVARTGYSSVFLTPSWRSASDTVIDVKYASFGATAADYGAAFSADYLKDKDPAYISPNKNVDASTCMFPEQTWFIRNYNHSYNSDAFDEMVMTMLYYDGQATVNTFAQYPRFMQFVSGEETLIPDTADPAAPTLFEKIKLFFIDLLQKMRSLFVK